MSDLPLFDMYRFGGCLEITKILYTEHWVRGVAKDWERKFCFRSLTKNGGQLINEILAERQFSQLQPCLPYSVSDFITLNKQ